MFYKSRGIEAVDVGGAKRCVRIGRIIADPQLRVSGSESFDVTIDQISKAWLGTLDW